jgi:hypothetical protein
MPTEEEWKERGLEKYGLIVVNQDGDAAQVEKVNKNFIHAYTNMTYIYMISMQAWHIFIYALVHVHHLCVHTHTHMHTCTHAHRQTRTNHSEAICKTMLTDCGHGLFICIPNT